MIVVYALAMPGNQTTGGEFKRLLDAGGNAMKTKNILVTVSKSVDAPHMIQPLPIIGVSIGVSVDTMTLSDVLNPGSCHTTTGL